MFAIGPHLIDNPVFLAPMAGISDRPFRDLCARHGAGYAASEMISSDTLLHATAKTQHRIQRASNGLPHAVQIAGSCLLYTSPSPRDLSTSRMPSSA